MTRQRGKVMNAFDCVYEKLKAEERLSEHYKKERDAERQSAFYWQNLHDRKVAELTIRLDEANEIINQQYVDENGTVWTIPTPEAYAMVCKKMHGLKTSNELLRIRLSDYKAWIQKHRTDRRLKWIDVNNAMPKPGENCVVLFDNGIVDVGYLGKVTNHWVSHGFVCLNTVTHWMPIPQIPKE